MINFPDLFADLRKYAFKGLLALAALGTIFPLVANKLSETLGISLRFSFHLVYSIYFILPTLLILFWVYKHKEEIGYREKLKVWKMPTLLYALFNLAGAFCFGSLMFGLSELPELFFWFLIVGLAVSYIHFGFIVYIYRKNPEHKNAGRLTVGAVIMLLLGAILCLLILQKRGRENLMVKIISGDNHVYKQIEELKCRWSKEETKLQYLELMAKKTDVKNLFNKTNNHEVLNFLNQEVPIIEGSMKINSKDKKKPPTLSPRTYQKLEVVYLSINRLAKKAIQGKLTKVFNKVFYKGILYFIFLFVLLINLHLSSNLFTKKAENPKDDTKKKFPLKDLMVLIILLAIPIFRAVESKDVSLNHPIWPVTIEQMITGGGGYSTFKPTYHIDKSVELKGDNLEEVRDWLDKIKKSIDEVEKDVEDNNKKLIVIDNTTDNLTRTVRSK